MSRQLVGMVALSAVACTTLIGLPDLPDISGGGSPGGGSSGAEAEVEAGATSHGAGAPSGGNRGSAGGDSVAAGEAGIANENGGSGASNVGGANTGGTSAAGANTGGTSAAGTTAGGTSAGAGGAHAGAGGAGAGSGGTSAGAGGMNAGGGGGGGTKTAPCDIYKTGGTPCVAAHSTVRALFGAYTGKLYQVRDAGGTTKDITAVSAGGVADAAAQDAFCAGTMCGITVVYDQTGKGNDLQYQGPDSPVGGVGVPASATTESIKIGGSKAYSLYINSSGSKNSYWVNGSSKGMPTGAAPEGMYMVTSGKHYNSGCCFDYGNSEIDRHADGAGTVDALYFGSDTAWGTGAGSGPWVMADLEFGLFAQGNSMKNVNDLTQTGTFVTAVLKNNGTTEYALRGSDATSGTLGTYYKGALPNGYSPMKKQGAIVLGSGGDCCLSGSSSTQGTFYEGCIVSGYPTDATEDEIQANIVAAGYATSPGL